MVDGDVRHAILHQTTGRQQTLADFRETSALRGAVLPAECVLLKREVEGRRRLTEDDVARSRAGGLELRVRRQTIQRSAAREALLDLLLELLRTKPAWIHAARRHDAVHFKLLRGRTSARHERRVFLAQEADFREASLALRENHERRQLAFVEEVGLHGVLPSRSLRAGGRDQRAQRRESHTATGVASRLHQIGRRLVSEERMGHRADDRIEVRTLRQLGHPFVELDAGVGLDRLQTVVVVMRSIRLRIKRLQLRGATSQPDLDDALGELPLLGGLGFVVRAHMR